jgi:hypothetical protein
LLLLLLLLLLMLLLLLLLLLVSLALLLLLSLLNLMPLLVVGATAGRTGAVRGEGWWPGKLAERAGVLGASSRSISCVCDQILNFGSFFLLEIVVPH